MLLLCYKEKSSQKPHIKKSTQSEGTKNYSENFKLSLSTFIFFVKNIPTVLNHSRHSFRNNMKIKGFVISTADGKNLRVLEALDVHKDVKGVLKITQELTLVKKAQIFNNKL